MRLFNGYRKFMIGAGSLAGLMISATVGAAEHSFETEFKEIRETSVGVYAIYTITNTGERDIDDVKLGLWLKDKDGNTIGSMGTSEQVPGTAWLAAGASREVGVSIDRSPEARTILERDPDEATLVVDVREMTFMKDEASSK